MHLRPLAHFTARDTWINDPNGLVHLDGVYHLFFQTNPYGSVWADMSWGHATSTDLLTWDERPLAIERTDEELVFSGSAVHDAEGRSGLAGPGRPVLVAFYTSAYTPPSPRAGIQAQSLAFSVDGGETWERHAGNPVLDRGSSDFRDPKVFRYGGADGHWVMVTVEALEHRVLVHTSTDLLHWTFRSDVGPLGAVGGVWECPDLFPLTVRGTGETRWVLVVSLNPGAVAGGSGTQYFVGDFDGAVFTPERFAVPAAGAAGAPDHPVPDDDEGWHDWLDHGRDFYAGVSWNDAPDGRRLLIGWANNWDYANTTPTHPWRSTMSLVRELDLVRLADGRLRVAQRPVLPPVLPDVPDGGAPGPRVHEVDVDTAPGSRTELVLASADGGSRVALTVDGDRRTLSVDRTRSGAVDFHPLFASVDTAPLLGDGPTAHVRLVVDGCLLEVDVDDGLVTVTQQVFPHAALTELHVGPAGPAGEPPVSAG